MTRNHWISALAVVVVIGGAGLWVANQGKSDVPAFPINPADHISSWSFKSPYAGNEALVTQTNADMEKLKSELGKGTYDDYDIHIGLANDNDLLGNGRAAYDEYNCAIAIHTDKGLAYANLAHLMDELGAKETAADAYGKAVAVEPILQFHLARLNYLTTTFPNDNPRLVAAFTDASKAFGDIAEVLQIEAEWLTGQKRYKDAIAAWQRAKLLMPGKDTSAIDREIARLKAKL